MNPADVVEQLTALAEDHGTSLRTLYRWMDAYEEKGLPGIMRAVSRKDKGTRPSICAAAYQYAYGLYADKVKRTQATIYNKLVDKAAVLGPDACQKCIFCEGTEARARLMETGEINHYPPCAEPVKAGMRVPECRQTLSRMLAAIPSDEVTLARRGVKAWKDDHMFMAVREKPQTVNEVWFGDHHQFDCFVLDETGKPVRPWLTAWYDAATGCLVGWVLCTNPNTETITEAFIRGVAHTEHSPFYGLPAHLYIDNGKDYRSKTFETGLIKEHDLGYLNCNIASNSVIQLFNVTVHHAQPLSRLGQDRGAILRHAGGHLHPRRARLVRRKPEGTAGGLLPRAAAPAGAWAAVDDGPVLRMASGRRLPRLPQPAPRRPRRAQANRPLQHPAPRPHGAAQLADAVRGPRRHGRAQDHAARHQVQEQAVLVRRDDRTGGHGRRDPATAAAICPACR